jgi:hypothetical protein
VRYAVSNETEMHVINRYDNQTETFVINDVAHIQIHPAE